jgi:AcrR family transcriptional regulator
MATREAQRLQTRARLFDAALIEISRSGLAGADVSAIAGVAGVVRGTFYFHFPTKEHVLVELERSEEIKIVEELSDAAVQAGDLSTILSMLVRLITAAETRLGANLFREMLALHFSSARPVESELARHPLAEYLIGVFADAQQVGRVVADADAAEMAAFLLTGLFALLATGAHHCAAPDALLSRYITTLVKGMEKR